jgi:hypothetical protein
MRITAYGFKKLGPNGFQPWRPSVFPPTTFLPHLNRCGCPRKEFFPESCVGM